jgi:hypothetical protein
MRVNNVSGVNIKYWWLVPLYWIFISHTILIHTVVVQYFAWDLAGGCRLDVDLELVFCIGAGLMSLC